MRSAEITDDSVDAQLLRIKNGDERFLRALYERVRPTFASWFQKTYSISRQQSVDLFQKAFSIFYFNTKDGKIVSLRSTIDTYLFGIGKVLMKEEYRRDSKLTSLDDVPDISLADYSIFNPEKSEHEQDLLKKVMIALEEPCKSLLIFFYFNNYSLARIAEELGYKNEGVVKKKKCLCLKALRGRLIENNIQP
jgi:DNA-directed RNA polymerase specialized sigma24 family protein